MESNSERDPLNQARFQDFSESNSKLSKMNEDQSMIHVSLISSIHLRNSTVRANTIFHSMQSMRTEQNRQLMADIMELIDREDEQDQFYSMLDQGQNGNFMSTYKLKKKLKQYTKQSSKEQQNHEVRQCLKRQEKFNTRLSKTGFPSNRRNFVETNGNPARRSSMGRPTEISPFKINTDQNLGRSKSLRPEYEVDSKAISFLNKNFNNLTIECKWNGGNTIQYKPAGQC